MNNNKSICITISLPPNLVKEINSKRGYLTKSQACQILLRTALDIVHGSLIPNITDSEEIDE